ncbi:hypothetical protein CRYUN_Cryun09bG0162100 [Craigia yunnanensis]
MIVSKNFRNGAVNEKTNIDFMGINLCFDSAGLGIFNAFFTSLSMIIISEGCSSTNEPDNPIQSEKSKPNDWR